MKHYHRQCYRCLYISTILTFIIFVAFLISDYRLDNNSVDAEILTISDDDNILNPTVHNNSSTTRFSAIAINNIIRQSSSIVRNRSLTIGIYVAIKNRQENVEYEFAQSTLRCYARLHNYQLQFDYADDSAIIREKCTQTDVSAVIYCASFNLLLNIVIMQKLCIFQT
jgi:hypothetical protein